MTPEQADREAHYWMGFARGVARATPRPPTYTAEDWEAEAFLGLAVALKRLEPRGPRATFAPFIRRVISGHLSTARTDAYRSATPGPGGASRAEWANVHSMDEPGTAPEGGDEEALDRHELLADPNSPNPYERAVCAELRSNLDAWAATATPTLRAHLGYLLAGLTPSELAPVLGVTVDAVQGARKRLRAELRTYLQARGYACP